MRRLARRAVQDHCVAPGLNPSVQIANAGTPIVAGSFLSFCSSVSAANVDVDLTGTIANVDLGTFHFTTVSQCA